MKDMKDPVNVLLQEIWEWENPLILASLDRNPQEVPDEYAPQRVLNRYLARQLEPKKGGVEGRRARRIRDRQRHRAKAQRIADVVWRDPLGTLQIFARGSEVNYVEARKSKKGWWLSHVHAGGARFWRYDRCEPDPSAVTKYTDICSAD